MNIKIKNITFLFAFLCVGISSFSQKNKKETTRILFIFDGSNSMNSVWQQSSKIKVAKKLMYETMEELSVIDNLEVGLRIYGHQTRIRPGQQDCSDTKLEVPFGKDNFTRIKSKINSLVPKGTTPIARSLEAAAKDFPPCDNCRNVIILITDGIEACDEDPCAVAKMLREKGIEVRPYVIGIAMDIESLKNFKCIGKSYDASTEESFKSVMKVVMSEALNNTTVQVNLLNSSGKVKETDVPMTFAAPVKAYHYLLRHAVDIDAIMATDSHAEVSHDLIGDILEGAASFTSEVLAPLNWTGDQHHPALNGGDVTASKGFKDAYAQFVEAGHRRPANLFNRMMGHGLRHLLCRRVGAVFTVHFGAGDRRVEAASHVEVFLGAQDVLVVFVERVHGSGLQRVNLSGGNVFHLALPLNNVVGFNVVLVPHVLLGAGLNGGFVQGEANIILGKQKAPAGPHVSAHIAFTV